VAASGTAAAVVRDGDGDEGAQEARGAQDEREAEPVDARPPVDRALSRLGGTLGGRPLSVYGVLLAGAAVLLILLAIIWITAGGGGGGEGPTCFDVEFADALELIKAGEVERVRVTFAEERANVGPISVNLSLVDDTCRNLQPQGVEGEPQMYMIIGAVEYWNQTSDERRIDLSIEASDAIPVELLWTQTPIPTETVVPTPTVPPPTEGPASPTAVPSTETVAPTSTAMPTVTPIASPDASPAGSPTGNVST
jgi:hypothetical protein